jgi:hypothetical protein
MAHVLVIIGKVLALAGFSAMFILLIRWCFPRSAGRVRASALIYAGGMTSKRMTGSWGTVSLELGDSQMAIRGRGPFRPLIRWEARYGDLSQVQAVRGLGTSGLLLRGRGGPIAFWTLRWAEIADLLELRAVLVSRDVRKISWKEFS